MSNIEWTEETWNPTTGCDKVSQGCKNCYAETMAKRLRNNPKMKDYRNGFKLTLQPHRLDHPKKFKKPKMFFVNSMSDLFHEKIPFEFIDRVMDTIRETPHHRYQILTKRPEVMRHYFGLRKPPPNTWLGVSVENKKQGVPRIGVLRSIPGVKVRFLSVEPLLEDLGMLNLRNIHWVIVGGESGKKARPMEQWWVTDIWTQCRKQNVPFFFKQWGTWGEDGVKRSKKANGRLLMGHIREEMPVSERITQ